MEGEFKPGEHLNTWCNLIQYNKLLSILSARKHSKSEIIHAYLAWRIFNMDYTYIEKWLYISYTDTLAGEHLGDTKERIRVNPFFQKEGIRELTDAKTILYYQKGGNRFFCQPSGIQGFKRGKHPDGVITDDILADPEVKLDVSQILKINKIFFEQVMSLPKEGGLGLKNIGTAQDESDLFHELENKKQFNCSRWDAEKDTKGKVSLWPEMFSWDRLKEIETQEIGHKAYLKEFRCIPVRSTEGYFLLDEIDDVIYSKLRNRKTREVLNLNEYSYGGLDLGKKRHPSHLSVYGKNRKGEPVQLLSYWMDEWDYKDQLELCREVIKNFKIHRLLYDDTRAEFEGFREEGRLPAEMEGVTFTKKKKFEIAATFEKSVKSRKMKMLDDPRQKRQILNCDNDLQSMETPEGHGDAFWSNALAFDAMQEGGGRIRFL